MLIDSLLYLLIPSIEIKIWLSKLIYCSIILSTDTSSMFLNKIESCIKKGKTVSFKIAKSNSIRSAYDFPVPVFDEWS